MWFPTSPDQRMLWPSQVTFSQEFYTTLATHALPVNIHAVRAFAGSPRKLDMLLWLGYRLNNLKEPLNISWEALKEQFGMDYTRDRDFRRHFAEEINEIREVFDKLPVRISERGLTLQPAGAEVIAIPCVKASRKP